MKKQSKIKRFIAGIVLFVFIVLAVLLRNEIFFYVIPFFGGNAPILHECSGDNKGIGYIHPLMWVNPNDDATYAFVYYDEAQPTTYYICDDSDYIKTHRNGFIIYNSPIVFDYPSCGFFHLYKNNEIVHDVNDNYTIMLNTQTHSIIYNKPFINHMTVLELDYDGYVNFCVEKGWDV